MSKKLKLRMENPDGTIVKEDELIIGDGDKLLIELDKSVTLREALKIHDQIKAALAKKSKILVYRTENFKVKVLRVEEGELDGKE